MCTFTAGGSTVLYHWLGPLPKPPHNNEQQTYKPNSINITCYTGLYRSMWAPYGPTKTVTVVMPNPSRVKNTSWPYLFKLILSRLWADLEPVWGGFRAGLGGFWAFKGQLLLLAMFTDHTNKFGHITWQDFWFRVGGATSAQPQIYHGGKARRPPGPKIEICFFCKNAVLLMGY